MSLANPTPDDLKILKVAAAGVALHALLSNLGVNETPEGQVAVAFRVADVFVAEALRQLA